MSLLSGEEGGRIQNSGLLGPLDRHPDEAESEILVLGLGSKVPDLGSLKSI